MVREAQSNLAKKPISLLLVEGDTDMFFYKRIKNSFIKECRTTIQNLQGVYNINKKVINSIVDYVQLHRDEKIRVYCCFDRDSRYGQVPEFDIKKIRKYVKDENIKNILSINLIRATQQIESWFLYDIEGIYEYIKVPRSQRNPKAFRPPEKFGYRHLQRLFERYGKTYTKGKKAGNFINHLDTGKIVSNCKELRQGIELIQSQADDLTNHFFLARNRKDS
ncbi:MAG: DUF4276 family protein [Sedimentisphaerales bacterium]|jgi:hypothetical protein